MSKKLIAGAGVVASFAIALAPLATFAANGVVSDQHADELVVTVLPSCTFGSAKKTTDDAAYFPGGITHDSYGAGTPEGITATSWNITDGGTDTGNHDSSTDHFSGAGHVDVASTGYGTNPGEGGAHAASGTEGQEGYVASNLNASEHTVHRSMLAGTSTDTFAQTTMYVVCNNGGGYTVTSTAEALSNGTESIGLVAANAISPDASGYNGIVTVETGDNANGMTRIADVVQTNETIIATKSGVSKENGDSLTVTYGMGIASSQKADTYAGKVTYKLYKGLNSADNVIPPSGS